MRSFSALFLFLWTAMAFGLAEERCIDMYRMGEYDKSADCLNSVLYSGAISDSMRLARCYEHLGVCLTMLDKKIPAKAAFKKLLDLDDDRELNPNIYLPEIISLFQIAKFEKKTSLKVLIVDTIPAYSTVYNFMPFAVPQYLNTQKKKGWIFLSLQTAAVGLSFYGFFSEQSYFSSDYGLREEDVPSARRFDMVHKISLLGFATTYVVSLVDGFINKRIEVQQ